MTYLDKDKMEMIFEVILEHIFGGRVRARVSQKQSVVEWGGEAILLLHPEIVFFFCYQDFENRILTFYIKYQSKHFAKGGTTGISGFFFHPYWPAEVIILQEEAFCSLWAAISRFKLKFFFAVLAELCKEPWVDNGEVRRYKSHHAPKLPIIGLYRIIGFYQIIPTWIFFTCLF